LVLADLVVEPVGETAGDREQVVLHVRRVPLRDLLVDVPREAEERQHDGREHGHHPLRGDPAEHAGLHYAIVRMVHYFAAFAALAVPALVWAAITGFAGGGERHVSAGLVAAVLAVLAHTLVILFMLVTGRVLKEAIASRPFPRAFLDELNEFFARKKAYPAALLGASATAAAAVLGYAHRGFGTPT